MYRILHIPTGKYVTCFDGAKGDESDRRIIVSPYSEAFQRKVYQTTYKSYAEDQINRLVESRLRLFGTKKLSHEEFEVVDV